MLTVKGLVDTGAGPKLVIKDFLPPAWRVSIKIIQLPPLRTSNCEVVSVKVMGPLFVLMGNLRVYPRFAVVENLAVGMLLVRSSIDRHIVN